MIFRAGSPSWLRNRFAWAAIILVAVATGAVLLVRSADPQVERAELQAQVLTRMRTTLERSNPKQHHHAGHAVQQVTTGEQSNPAVICGVHVYGFEPAEVNALADVRTVYGFHLCGIAEHKRPWDVAVKLAGPVILDMSVEPPGIRVVEATADVRFVDRLREMFPRRYAELAQKEALPESEMADLRRRYAAAARL